jgi:hypothetical protein
MRRRRSSFLARSFSIFRGQLRESRVFLDREDGLSHPEEDPEYKGYLGCRKNDSEKRSSGHVDDTVDRHREGEDSRRV